MKNLLLLLSVILLSQCSPDHESRLPQSGKGQTIESPIFSQEESMPKQYHAGMNPFTIQENKQNSTVVSSQTNIQKSAVVNKNIPIKKLFDYNLKFVENKGQLERFGNFRSEYLTSVRFYSRAFSGAAYFADNGIGYGFTKGGWEVKRKEFDTAHVMPKLSKEEKKEQTGFHINFLNSNKDVVITGKELGPTKINFLKGSPDLFITDIQTYDQIHYSGLYNGIDMAYYSINGELKYDFILKPNADVNQIQLKYQDVKEVRVQKNGDLEIEINWGILYDRKPYSYQMINGKKKEVTVKYMITDSNTVGFKITGKYDRSKELVIDPFTVQWSTYVGLGTSDDGYIESTVIDGTGRTVGTGWTNNAFPISASANGYNKTHNGGTDAYVYRLSIDGATIDYVTYLGGSGNETGTGIALTTAGDICVSGHTASYAQSTIKQTGNTTTLTIGVGTFNVTVPAIGAYGMGEQIQLKNGANTMNGSVTGFVNATTISVTITSVSGSGTFSLWDIYTINQLPFPTTAGAPQTSKTGLDANEDIFFVKLNGSGNNLIYGTYYGGSATNSDWALDLILDGSNNAYITGRTQTTAGFSTAGVWKTAAQGGYDGFVLKINSAGTIGYCTYLGGAGNDVGKGIAVNSSGEVYVTGMTSSASLGTAGVYQINISGTDDAFLLKLSSTGTLAFYTYLGGVGKDCGGSIDLTSTNEPIIIGTTASSDFPKVLPFDNTYSAEEAFITKFNTSGTAIVYSSYIGGDGSDNVKGFDYTQYHKNGGIKIVGGKAVVVVGIQSSTASMSPFLILPISFTAVDQAGATYAYSGGTYKGGALGDLFLTVFSANGQAVEFGSYFGGTDNDYPTAGVNVQTSTGCVIFGGGVHSLPYPVTVGAFKTQRTASSVPDQIANTKVCLFDILPVTFNEFKAIKREPGIALLYWSTSSEINNSHYVIEKSLNGVNFYTIGSVPGQGNSSVMSQYDAEDNDFTSSSYYRLKQVDLDGKIHYSQIRHLPFDGSELLVYPNPAKDQVTIKYQMTSSGVIDIEIVNELGQTVMKQNEEVKIGSYTKQMNIAGLSDGVYLMKVIINESFFTRKLIKE